jgi:TonB family protein
LFFALQVGTVPPRLVNRIEPEYSDEARIARLNGTVSLYVVIRPDGHADDIKVIRSLGLGLDQNAIDAVRKWSFSPGEKNGSPVSVQATIQVNFRVLPNHSDEPAWYTGQVAFQMPEGASRPTLQFAKFPPNGSPPEPGTVTLSCTIDQQGAPTALRVDKSTAATLDAEALSIVGQWRFRPATQNGKPVAVPATLEIVFGSPGAPAKPKNASVPL